MCYKTNQDWPRKSTCSSNSNIRITIVYEHIILIQWLVRTNSPLKRRFCNHHFPFYCFTWGHCRCRCCHPIVVDAVGNYVRSSRRRSRRRRRHQWCYGFYFHSRRCAVANITLVLATPTSHHPSLTTSTAVVSITLALAITITITITITIVIVIIIISVYVQVLSMK